jgi:NitT/TauT family transport system substrate-binding protein
MKSQVAATRRVFSYPAHSTKGINVRRSRSAAVALLLAGTLGLAACGDSSGQSQAEGSGSAAASRTKLLQPSVTNSALALPLWMPLELGLFEEQGLDIEYIDAPSSKSVDLYIAKEFKFGWSLGNMIPAVVAAGRDINLYEVDIAKIGYGFWVQPGINSLGDLKGKSVGISGFGGQPHQATLALFKREGFSPDDVTFVAAGTVSDIVTSMASGQVAGGAFGPPASVVAEKQGLKQLFDLTELPETTPQTVVVGDPAWVEENEKAAMSWMRAFIEGLWVIHTNPEKVNEVLTKRLAIDLSTDDGKRLLKASAKIVQDTVRDPREVGNFDDLIPSLKENFPDKKRLGDISVVKPKIDLVKQLADEGLFKKLEEKYGPLPG